MKIEKFDVSVSPAKIEQLKQRLASANWPDVIGEDEWSYGVPSFWMRAMVDYWLNDWSWKMAEEERVKREERRQVRVCSSPQGPNPQASPLT